MTKVVTNYQSLSAELDEVLARLQDPEVDIDAAVKLYERGQQLLAELEIYLKTAENKITKLKKLAGAG